MFNTILKQFLRAYTQIALNLSYKDLNQFFKLNFEAVNRYNTTYSNANTRFRIIKVNNPTRSNCIPSDITCKKYIAVKQLGIYCNTCVREENVNNVTLVKVMHRTVPIELIKKQINISLTQNTLKRSSTQNVFTIATQNIKRNNCYELDDEVRLLVNIGK